MPLPLAHSAAGFVVKDMINENQWRNLSPVRQYFLIALAIAAANLADFDFLPGFLIQQPNSFHHGPSHSIVAAIVFAGALWGMTHRAYKEISPKRYLLILSIAALSHPFLDFISSDTSYPYGIPLLWPFLPDYMISPYLFFGEIHKSGLSNKLFFLSLWHVTNLREIFVETLFAVMLISGVKYYKKL